MTIAFVAIAAAMLGFVVGKIRGRYNKPDPLTVAEALRESEERFRTAFLTSPDAITINSIKDAIYIEVNDGFLRMSGYTREEIIGKSSLALGIWNNPEDRTRLTQGLQEHGFYENLESTFRMKDGSVLWGLMSAKILIIQGEPHILSITRNMTERKQSQLQLEQTNSWLTDAQRIAKLGYYSFDLMTNAWTSSEMLDEIFGIESLFVRNAESWVSLVHPLDQREMSNYLVNDIIGQRKAFNKEYRVLRAIDQKTIWVHGHGKLVFSETGNLARMFGTIQDITERKTIEIEKDRLVNELKARQAEQESLIYAMSHDLRSPLVNVLGFTNELERELRVFMQDPPKIKELLPSMQDSMRFIVQSAQHMDRLQNGILRYARLGRMEFSLQKVDCRILIERCMQGLEHQARTLNITFENKVEHDCIADQFALEQICNNLLDNAIKYARVGIAPHICIGSAEEQGTIILSFRDNGCGIPTPYRHKIFEIFHRLDPHGSVPGEGLGLTLVRGLLHHMDGNISISDTYAGPGTEFLVTLPAA